MEANSQKMREALEGLLDELCSLCDVPNQMSDSGHSCNWRNRWEGCQSKAVELAVTALAAPPRNCDLYNNVEDSWQDYKQFRRQIGEAVYFDMVHFWPFAKWLFAKAAERKGAGDGR